ncbi:MAG: carotenoid biosynthesis protein [Thermomicrobiales bacterium]
MHAADSVRNGQPHGRMHALRWTLLALFACFAIGWALAVVGISRNMRLPVNERWAGSSMLFLEGMIALLWIVIAYSWRHAVWFALVVLPSAFVIELIGVTVGLPFGPYHYTDALAPSIAGRVPAPITFAWLMIALGTLATATWIVQREKPWAVIPVAALLATGLDACLEPTAYHVKAYWLWDTSGRYYGVPAINFLGWLCTSACVTALAASVLRRSATMPRPALVFVPISLYWATVLMFAIIDGFRGYPVGAATGAALCLMALRPLRRWHRGWQALSSGRPDPSTSSHRARATAPNSRE